MYINKVYITEKKMKKLIFFPVVLCMMLNLAACSALNSNITEHSAEPTQHEEIYTPDVTEYPTAETVTESPVTPVPETDKSGNPLTVSFIDVGQGDSTFIALPNGQTMLIDAGNPQDSGTILSVIKKYGFSRLDYVVATHPHSDHIGGMAEVISAVDVGKLYMPKKSHTTKTFENLVNTIANKGLSINTAKAGVNILDEGSLRIDILSPISDSYSDLNDYSAVVKIVYGNTSFLFMGDAENSVEYELLNDNADISADIIKIGHHGSSYSSAESFISAVHPNYAVISCGTGNSYGHPHQETLALLQQKNVNVYRTDETGTITAVSDGETITLDKNASTIQANAPPVVQHEEVVQKSEQDQSSAGGNEVVYITKTGKRYHRSGCSSLSKSKIESTIEQARAKGLTPCQKCNPPQ